MFTDTFFNKNNEFHYVIYIDTKFVLVVDFRSDSDTHTTARHKGRETNVLAFFPTVQLHVLYSSRKNRNTKHW